MTRKNHTMVPDLFSDPFRERSSPMVLEPLQLASAQTYAANQPEWTALTRSVSGVDAFELRRGRHPLELGRDRAKGRRASRCASLW